MNWERRLQLRAHPYGYPLMRALAKGGPVIRVPWLGVVVNDAALARQILLDGETFRKDGPGAPADLWTPILGPSVLVNMEGESHRALRRRLAELFAPGYTERLCERVLAEPLASLADRLTHTQVDLADAVRVMAGAVMCHVIGLDTRSENDYRRMFRAGERVVSMVKLRTRRLSDDQIALARSILEPIGDISATAFRLGREDTVMGRMRALGLSEQEARGAAGAFFLTGTETVATLLPRLIALLHDSHQMVRVAADLSLVDTAIEEAMRVTTPTPVMVRSVHAHVTVGGLDIRPGERVLIATLNCCRAAGPFNLDRPHPPELRRLWFGAGPHFCIGYPLAMSEVRCVTRAVLGAGPVRIVSRKATPRVLIPAYRSLVIAR